MKILRALGSVALTLSLFVMVTIPRATDAGITVIVQGWGGGGGGSQGNNGNGEGQGGGAGAYSQLSSFVPTSAVGYAVVVGAGGAGGVHGVSNGIAGNDSSFNSTSLVAKGGGANVIPNPGGAASSGTGDIKWSGGAGGPVSVTTTNFAGDGGGGSGGDATDGGKGGSATSATAQGVGGTAGSAGGAAGGQGGTTATNGTGGSIPGGGGGGGHGGSGGPGTGQTDGGAGARGQIVVLAPTGLITSATGGTHTVANGYDVWTFTANGTWTPTFTNNATVWWYEF